MVRLYRPRAEILNGSWVFPEAQRYGESEVVRPVARETRERAGARRSWDVRRQANGSPHRQQSVGAGGWTL
jgi:hypothetical protein